MITVTKKDLIALGYGTSFAADIIREAKKLMISKGHTYYQSRKLDRVLRKAVEELLDIRFQDGQADGLIPDPFHWMSAGWKALPLWHDKKCLPPRTRFPGQTAP